MSPLAPGSSSDPQTASPVPGFPLWPGRSLAGTRTCYSSAAFLTSQTSSPCIHYGFGPKLCPFLPAFQPSSLTPRSMEGDLSLSHTWVSFSSDHSYCPICHHSQEKTSCGKEALAPICLSVIISHRHHALHSRHEPPPQYPSHLSVFGHLCLDHIISVLMNICNPNSSEAVAELL